MDSSPNPFDFRSPSPSHPGKIIVLEGGISAGKTTMARMLKEYLGDKVIIFYEPRNEAKLMEYISDMPKHGYSFQIFMAQERIKLYQRALEKSQEGFIVIIDRGLLGDLVFAKLQMEKGHMTQKQWDTYISLLKDEHLPVPDLIVYLKSDPVKCHQRMIKRGTDGAGYSLEYFLTLHRLHEDVVNSLVSTINITTTSFMEDLMTSLQESTASKGKEFWELLTRSF